MDNLRFINSSWEPIDFQLVDLMSNYLINFTSNSNPNNKDLPDWPVYNKKTSLAMVFDKNSGKQTLPDKDGLEFLLSGFDR